MEKISGKSPSGAKVDGPAPKSYRGRDLTPPAAPNAGQIKQSPQSGKTDAATDGGGGVGNSGADLHRMIGK